MRHVPIFNQQYNSLIDVQNVATEGESTTVTAGDRSEDVKENKDVLPQIFSGIQMSFNGIDVREILEDAATTELLPYQVVLQEDFDNFLSRK